MKLDEIYVSSTAETRENGDCIQITERPINVFNYQRVHVQYLKGTTHYINKTIYKIIYSNIT